MSKDTEKRSFLNYEDAQAELIRIIETKYNVCKSVKPARVYFSDITKMYHLTSKPNVVEYNK